MAIKQKELLDQLQQWVYEAHIAHHAWRQQSWRDMEFRDGVQWNDESRQILEDQEMDALTINKIFPIINLISGSQVSSRFNIKAKARTTKDSSISQVMTEGIQFVLDQNEGQPLISEAFVDQIVPGVGFLYVGDNPDPRKERIKVDYRAWYNMWWDPFSGPWFNPDKCRYVFYQPWMDMDDLKAIFWSKRKEIDVVIGELAGPSRNGDIYTMYDDHSTIIEEEKRIGNEGWVDEKRKRVRPVQMWYTEYKKGIYAVMPDGHAIEVLDDTPAMQQMAIIQQATEIMPAVVKKMRVCTFLQDLMLENRPTPFIHDQFPFAPFVGYLDRFQFPYGIPRNLREQNMEINKRRSMALALINSSRIITEEGVAEDMDALFDEARKIDGNIRLTEGSLESKRFVIQEMQQLAASQMTLLQDSQNEILEISGANAERMGQQSDVTSGVGIQKKIGQSNVMTAPLFANLKRSLTTLGELIVSGIQQRWTGPKVLRITDSMSMAERFVQINEHITNNEGMPEIVNNVTQGRYDVVISDAPFNDTARESYLQLVIEWVKKSPPEAIPPLMNLAFELSDLPNKENLMLKIKPLLGMNPLDEDMTPEQRKQQIIAELQQKQQKMAQQEAIQMQSIGLDLQAKQLENAKLIAEIEKILSDIESAGKAADTQFLRAQLEKARLRLESAKVGIDAQHKAIDQAQRGMQNDGSTGKDAGQKAGVRNESSTPTAKRQELSFLGANGNQNG